MHFRHLFVFRDPVWSNYSSAENGDGRLAVVTSVETVVTLRVYTSPLRSHSDPIPIKHSRLNL